MDAEGCGVRIYTDGSCIPNPGYGGNAFVVVRNDALQYKEFSESQGLTTNNEQELLAIIGAMKWIIASSLDGDTHTIFTDSKYCQNGINTWMGKWKENAWKTANNKPVANINLWKLIDNLLGCIKNKSMELRFEWVKGHSNDKWNDFVDKLAKNAYNI